MLVLFDGNCGFCDGVVRWLLRHDPAGRLRFAPLGGAAARAVFADHPELPAGLDSLVVVDGDRVYTYAQAAFRLVDDIPGWRVLTVLRLLPRAVTDSAYRTFARHRYRFFGRLDACPLPSPLERARFLP